MGENVSRKKVTLNRVRFVPEALSARSQHAVSSILASARKEIEKAGILGLRVADVAAGANCSITQIYRYFGDRDGLLARVLGDYYEESLRSAYENYMARMRSLESITIDDLVNNLPTPSSSASMLNQEVRLQILAVSVRNKPLRERLERISEEHLQLWNDGLAYVQSRMAKGLQIDSRVFTIMLLVQTMYYRTLLGDKGFTDEEYRQFLRDKLSA